MISYLTSEQLSQRGNQNVSRHLFLQYGSLVQVADGPDVDVSKMRLGRKHSQNLTFPPGVKVQKSRTGLVALYSQQNCDFSSPTASL